MLEILNRNNIILPHYVLPDIILFFIQKKLKQKSDYLFFKKVFIKINFYFILSTIKQNIFNFLDLVSILYKMKIQVKKLKNS